MHLGLFFSSSFGSFLLLSSELLHPANVAVKQSVLGAFHYHRVTGHTRRIGTCTRLISATKIHTITRYNSLFITVSFILTLPWHVELLVSADVERNQKPTRLIGQF